jgi:TolB-like protein/cytochrome c-type biogenesis protein CcmH/NrfG
LKRRLTAILAADIVNYSKMIGDDQTGMLNVLRQLRSEIFEPIVGAHRGTIIKSMGDGWIVEFASVTDAVSCIIQIQQNLVGHALIQLRAGINIGDVIFEEEDVFGDGVNVAARLEALAKPGGILISDTAYDTLDSKTARQFAGGEAMQLKNITRPVNVWHWPVDKNPTPDKVQSKTPLTQDVRTIAVLPFDNISGDPEQEYFADGISEDIITDLSKINSLFVIARNSSFAYKGKSIDIPTVARELGVQFVLEGSVRRGGDRVRVNAQLIDAKTGGHLWADRYDREMTDIFGVQDEVTANIVRALSITLGEEEQRLVGVKITGNFAAYELVLRGRELLLHGQDEEKTIQSRSLFEQAIEIDPGLGAAYAYLTLSYLMDYINGWSDDSHATLERAHDLAQRGVELTPNDAHARIALASVYMMMRQHDEAISEGELAVQMFPNYAHGLFELGWYLQYAGRAEESLDYFDRAVRLDPHHAGFFLHFMAQAYFQLERYEETVELLRRRLVRSPYSDSSRMLLASCYGYLGKHDAARKAWRELMKINPDFSLEQRRKVLPYKNPEDFEQIVIGLRKSDLPD